MQRPRPYWSGVRSRLLPALAYGLVIALVLGWLDDGLGRGALLVGLSGAVAAALLPPRRPRNGAES